MMATEGRKRHDAAEIKSHAQGRWPEILTNLGGIDRKLLDGKHHACPKCGGQDRFRLVNRDAGAVFCNQCFNQKNGDGLSALKWVNGWTFPETCDRLAGYLGVSNGNGRHDGNGKPDKPKQLFQMADAALAAYDERIEGERVGQWSYHNAKGEIVLVVARWNLPDGCKTIRPVSRTTGGWVHGDPPKPWPLYNLLEIPTVKRVLFVEGEKCADAAASIGFIATTTAHGCQSPQHTDFSPLAGKEVLLWPDRDESGTKYADVVTEKLLALRPRATVKRIQPPGLPQKADIVDWLEQYDAAEPEDLRQQIEDLAAGAEAEGALPIVSCVDVASKPARLRAPIIHGLQREGETLNIIGPSKLGKSWLGMGIGLSVASGIDWLDRYGVNQGRILYIDNELHPETFQHRIETVSTAMGLSMQDLSDFQWWSLRGKLCDLHGLAKKLDVVEPGTFRAIVLDAWYRFLPPGVDENDNGAVTQLYNVLDSIAGRLKCGFICVHHSSKGSQSGKAVTDVGSGAGAQSRACDTHLILRAHEEDGAYVLDAATRSFPPIEAIGCRFSFPLWSIDESLDPTRLRQERRRQKKEAAAVETPKVEPWTAERFAKEFVVAQPRNKIAIIASAKDALCSARLAEGLLALAEDAGHIHRHKRVKDRATFYSTVPQPVMETSGI